MIIIETLEAEDVCSQLPGAFRIGRKIVVYLRGDLAAAKLALALTNDQNSKRRIFDYSSTRLIAILFITFVYLVSFNSIIRWYSVILQLEITPEIQYSRSAIASLWLFLLLWSVFVRTLQVAHLSRIARFVLLGLSGCTFILIVNFFVLSVLSIST